MIVIKVLDQGIFITVISVYAPEYGLDDDQKYNFYDSLINVVTKFGEKDFNGQVWPNLKGFQYQIWISLIQKDRKWVFNMEKQPSRGAIIKMRPEKYHQINRRTPMPKCDPNKAAMQLYWSCTPTRALQHKQILKSTLQKSTPKRLHPLIFKNPN